MQNRLGTEDNSEITSEAEISELAPSKKMFQNLFINNHILWTKTSPISTMPRDTKKQNYIQYNN